LNPLKNVPELPVETILKGKYVALSISLAPCSQKKKPPDKPWRPPPSGWVKVIMDGSYKVDDFSVGLGMILRDDSGHILFPACRSLLRCEDAPEAEIQACLEVRLDTSQLGLDSVRA
jgi:hypothetical protein